mgnify:CR=1 FL=1
MKKLDKLNVALGSIQPPSTSRAPSPPFILSITRLSLDSVTVPSRLDPSSLPLVRSLHLSAQACQAIQLLLPQLDSLYINRLLPPTDLGLFIRESTSITSLALREMDIVELEDASKTVIQERIVRCRVIVSRSGRSGDSILAAILDASKAMKKVILDGVSLGSADQLKPRFLGTLNVVMAACKRNEIELGKENFEVGNGKVDLEK